MPNNTNSIGNIRILPNLNRYELAGIAVDRLDDSDVDESVTRANLYNFDRSGSWSIKKTPLNEKKTSKMKDTYLSIIQSDYQTLLSDAEKFGVNISEDKKNVIKNNIDVLNKLDSDLRQMLVESNEKQKDLKLAIDSLKEEMSDILNAKKFDDCMTSAEKFMKDRNWDSARACYDNALYYTKSHRDEVMTKINELMDIQSMSVVKAYIVDVEYYLSHPSSALLNRIIDRTHSLDMKFMVGEELELFKKLYSSVQKNKKINLLTAIIDNKTLTKDMKLGII